MTKAMNVRFQPGRWAEHLTPWEALWLADADAEPVRLGDHRGRERREHDGIEPDDFAAGLEPHRARVVLNRAGAAT